MLALFYVVFYILKQCANFNPHGILMRTERKRYLCFSGREAELSHTHTNRAAVAQEIVVHWLISGNNVSCIEPLL